MTDIDSKTSTDISSKATEATAQPTVTLVVPALNEESAIEACLSSLLAQDYPAISQILVLDGHSNDRTVELASRFGAPVEVLDNPDVTIAAAMNRGLAEATGELIFKTDAHTRYASDYVSACVRVLLESGADNVGGRMRAIGTNTFGKAVAAVTSSPFGIGPGRTHYSEERLDVETVYLGCWRTSYLRALDGWDAKNLHWAAEDDELNFRIRLNGGRIVLDPSIRTWYTPRQTPRALWRQHNIYGLAKTSSLAKHRKLPYLRPLVPAAFVTSSLVAAMLPMRWQYRVAIPAVHAAVSAAVAVKLARDEQVDPLATYAAIEICHWSYGLGFLQGIGRIVTGRGFATTAGAGKR